VIGSTDFFFFSARLSIRSPPFQYSPTVSFFFFLFADGEMTSPSLFPLRTDRVKMFEQKVLPDFLSEIERRLGFFSGTAQRPFSLPVVSHDRTSCSLLSPLSHGRTIVLPSPFTGHRRLDIVPFAPELQLACSLSLARVRRSFPLSEECSSPDPLLSHGGPSQAVLAATDT